MTLGAASLLAQGIGVPAALGGTGQPLPDGSFSPPSTLNAGVLLYPDEVGLIRQRAVDLNARIASIAAANGATVIDIHSLFDDIVAARLRRRGRDRRHERRSCPAGSSRRTDSTPRTSATRSWPRRCSST